jgi:hypothetical protein
MYEKTALCNKINEIYPEIGECDKDLKVVWDSERNVWDVNRHRVWAIPLKLNIAGIPPPENC